MENKGTKVYRGLMKQLLKKNYILLAGDPDGEEGCEIFEKELAFKPKVCEITLTNTDTSFRKLIVKLAKGNEFLSEKPKHMESIQLDTTKLCLSEEDSFGNLYSLELCYEEVVHIGISKNIAIIEVEYDDSLELDRTLVDKVSTGLGVGFLAPYIKNTVSITGHRPNKLWGYDLLDPKYLKLKEKIAEVVKSIDAGALMSGMALGTDTIFAELALELDLPLYCALPCTNQIDKWKTQDQLKYYELLKKASVVHNVTDKPYTFECMQLRNEFMVDNSDFIIAVWDGSSGGTANCVKYAKKQGKNVIYINPRDI